ncbi:hypothetical protein BH09PSE4_BH09PSE4_08570 [soil metagenome]
MINRFLLAVLPLVALSACADAGRGYPSLLPRPIEKLGMDEPVREAPAVVADPVLDAKIAALAKSLADTATAWAGASKASAARVTAARGQPVGSEAWIEAQTALADLDQYRAQTLGAVSELEDAAIARAGDGQQPYPALEALHDAAEAQLDAETKEIAERQTALPGS